MKAQILVLGWGPGPITESASPGKISSEKIIILKPQPNWFIKILLKGETATQVSQWPIPIDIYVYAHS